MKFNLYSIKDEDGIYGAPFMQVNDQLASVAVVSYKKKMPFMNVTLHKLGTFDTKIGITEIQSRFEQSVDYEKVYADYQIELSKGDDGVETSSLVEE